MSDTYVAQRRVNNDDDWQSTEHATLGEARAALEGWRRTGDACRILRIPDGPETEMQSYSDLLRAGIAEAV